MEQTEYFKLLERNNKVLIITKNNCPLCDELKLLFETIEVKFDIFEYKETENEINNGFPFKNEMKMHTNGKMFPFCYINSTYVGGYKEIHNNLMTGKLKDQLNKIDIDYEVDF